MSRIGLTFRRLQKANEAALIPYLTVGYPSLDITRRLLPVLARQGADLIELGVPFSDPLAGATIQRAGLAALQQSVTLADCLAVAAEARRTNEIPLVLMSHYNPLLKHGPQAFAEEAAASGIDGVIVPDLPAEEANELREACAGVGVDLIFLVTTASADERLERVASVASGFIYCVSVEGATGERWEPGPEMAVLVQRIRRYTELPLAVGSGISTPEQVAEVSRFADGAIVASALINQIESLPEDDLITGASDFLRNLKEATVRKADAQ